MRLEPPLPPILTCRRSYITSTYELIIMHDVEVNQVSVVYGINNFIVLSESLENRDVCGVHIHNQCVYALTPTYYYVEENTKVVWMALLIIIILVFFSLVSGHFVAQFNIIYYSMETFHTIFQQCDVVCISNIIDKFAICCNIVY